jgi:ABC-type glycerol-3-phosphate transport system permease component
MLNRQSTIKTKKLTASFIVHAILIVGAVIFLFPFLWMVITSLKPLSETTAIPPTLIPSKILWSNYKEATEAIPFWVFARNTLTVCLLSVIGTVVSSTIVAYGFSRIAWRGRDFVFYCVLATMMIPFPVIMVPLFVVFAKIGWVGSLKPLWVPTFFSGAFNIFLLRQFFRTIPMELSEAARIDGCSEVGILLRIIMPLSKPALLVVGLFQFIFSWNDFMGPLIYLNKEETYTLALGLQFFQKQHGGTQWNYLMAASALVVVPILVLYFFTQKVFIEGISMTGVKG